MKSIQILILTLAVWCGCASIAITAEVSESERVRIQKLISELGSDSFDAREVAALALSSLDQDALPLFDAALKASTDSEVTNRLKKLITALCQPHWLTDMDAAKKAAAAGGKPILVFSTIGEPSGFS